MFKTTDPARLGVLAVIIGAVLFVAVNIISNALFGGARIDATDGNIYTLSEETVPVFQDIKEPIVVRVYFSSILGEASPRHAVFYERVRELLTQYRDLSDGMLQVEYYDPEPFSDVEDRAVGFGLQAVPLGGAGEVAYFGLAATNSTDDQEVIPFFNLERESFIEYDLTKLVYTLSNPDQPTVGLVTNLPVDGGMTPGMGGMGGTPTPPWQIMEQMRDFFEVERLDADLTQIPDNIDVLVLAQPDGLSAQGAYAIDQWALSGKPVAMFIDPNLESGADPMGGGAADLEQAGKLLEAWGLTLEQGVVAGDLEAAVRVNSSQSGRPVISDYVAWLNLTPGNMNPDDPITGDLKNLTLATAGILIPAADAGLDIRPLIETGPESMSIEAEKVGGGLPDVVSLFREFQPSGEPKLLAARVSGPIKSAFADGKPENGDVQPEGTEGSDAPAHLTEAQGPVQIVVTADADMLADRFWVQESNFFGQRLSVPTADNASYLINILENLTGTPALSSLRGRGQQSRPFTLIEDIRREAEQQFRAKEQDLLDRLDALQSQIDNIQLRQQDGQQGSQGSDVLLSDEDQRAIANYRAEILSTRQELREVQRALREDIDRLEGVIKFINIAGVPIIFGIIMILVAVWRHRRATTVAV